MAPEPPHSPLLKSSEVTHSRVTVSCSSHCCFQFFTEDMVLPRGREFIQKYSEDARGNAGRAPKGSGRDQPFSQGRCHQSHVPWSGEASHGNLGSGTTVALVALCGPQRSLRLSDPLPRQHVPLRRGWCGATDHSPEQAPQGQPHPRAVGRHSGRPWGRAPSVPSTDTCHILQGPRVPILFNGQAAPRYQVHSKAPLKHNQCLSALWFHQIGTQAHSDG